MNERSNYEGEHILAENCVVSTDIWKTGLNNNVLIFGPSGSGKTRHYVKPNILNSHESIVVSDTKGALRHELTPALEKRGFEVLNIDFTSLAGSCGYNPLDYIRYDSRTDRYSEQDILTLAGCLISEWSQKEPYWDYAARQYFACLVSYVLESLPENEHTLEYVMRILNMIDGPEFERMMSELKALKPDSTAVLRYGGIRSIFGAEKMNASIKGIISTNLDSLCFDQALALYSRERRVRFDELGKRKTALFLTISDTDRSMDKLANALMTQAIQILCRSADQDCPDHRLTVPVRFYLDDFATNLFIPDFDKIISVIRSREISVSVILQSITQLYTLYGQPAGTTILNNCDRMLYLGGQDIDTAEYVSRRTDRPLHSILNMPIEDACLMIRGEEPAMTRKTDVRAVEEELKKGRAEDSSAGQAPEAQ